VAVETGDPLLALNGPFKVAQRVVDIRLYRSQNSWILIDQIDRASVTQSFIGSRLGKMSLS
jgi:hypothetical protein